MSDEDTVLASVENTWELPWYRQLIEAMQQGVATLSRDGILLDCNRSFAAMLNISSGTVRGTPFVPFVSPSDRTAWETLWQQAQASQSEGEIQLQRPDGEPLPVHLTLQALPSPSPAALGLIVTNLTAQKQLEETARRLREAERHKDEFLAMLAHELRNPLAPIGNALHIVHLRGNERRLGVRQAHDIIERQVEHLIRLVDDLLDVSRITHGQINLRMEPIEVATIVARAVEGSRPLIDSRRHQLEIVVPDEPLRVQGDPTRLAQVLWNLLNNAAKYTPEGGHIRLSVEKGTCEVIVRVRDTGMGIPPEVLPKVFDLFKQAERTLDRAQGGLGIGLTLVRQLTAMHNGTVGAYSAGPGQGSEFVVRLPLLASQPGDVPSETALPPLQPRPQRRILVVDDNRDSADSLATLLRLVGNDVRTAYDGWQALETAATYQPNLILLDIGLPGLDGYEVARRLRSEPGFGKPVLTALTGYSNEEDRRRSLAAGFNYHMVKPVDFTALQEMLTSLEENTARE